MVSFISMSSNTLKKQDDCSFVIENANKENELALSFLLEIVNSNSLTKSSDDSSSQSMDEDSSHLDLDLFHSSRFVNGKHGVSECRSKKTCVSDNHNAPHIEFLSPPPEFTSIV